MKFSLLHGLTAALTISGTALAQQTIGPFFLRLQSNDSYINGRYLGAYHSGAAQATLGIDQKTRPPADAKSSYIYTLNYTGEGDSRRGELTWVLIPGRGIPAVLSLGLGYSGLGTNVAPTTLDFGGYANVGFDDENRLYLVDGPDDSQNQSGFEEDGGWRPNQSDTHNLRHWHACWQTAGISYYYWSLGWVTAGAPHNPTCKPVEVIKVDV